MPESHKILVVRVGRVGDMVMITAALNAILEHYKQAEVHVLTGNDGMRVLKGFNSRVTQFYDYNRKSLNPWWLRYKLKKLIGQEKYTHIFCFETNPGYLDLFSKSQASVHLITNCTPDRNFAWHCLQTVNRVIQSDLNNWVNLKVYEIAKAESKQIFIDNGVDDEKFIIGLHPSFSGLKKIKFRSQRSLHERGWGEKNWAELAIKLMDYAQKNNKNIQIIMDLLEEDRKLGERIVALSNNTIKMIIPEMNFERYKATLQSMDLFITPNTGPMHVAGALGVKMVALFAVESPDNCGPYIPVEQYTAISAEDMPKSELGLVAISVDDVLVASKPYIS